MPRQLTGEQLVRIAMRNNKRKATNDYYRNMPRFKRARTTVPQRAPNATRGWGSPVGELKVNELTTTAYDVNTTGSITLLCNPSLGSDYTSRIGRKITIRNYYIRGWVTPSVQAATSGGLVGPSQLARMIILIDMQPNGSAPAITDILSTASPSSHINLNYRDRFKILTDKVFPMDASLLSTTNQYVGYGKGTYAIKKYKKCKIDVIFNSTNGGTIADISSGALYMVWIGSQASGAVDAVANIATRVRYSDT